MRSKVTCTVYFCPLHIPGTPLHFTFSSGQMHTHDHCSEIMCKVDISVAQFQGEGYLVRSNAICTDFVSAASFPYPFIGLILEIFHTRVTTCPPM